MQIRPKNKINLAPPKYDEKSRFLTLSIHFGGKFNLGGIHAYVGGSLCKFDFYEFDMLVLEYLKKLVEHGGAKKLMRVFTDVNPGGFKFIQDDNDLVSICEEKLKTAKEISLYFEEERLFCPYVPTEVSLKKIEEKYNGIDRVDEEDECESESESESEDDVVDGMENGTVGTRKNNDTVGLSVGVDNDTIGVGLEDNIYDDSDDFNESDYREETEIDDDELFNCNVDNDCEWIGHDDELEMEPNNACDNQSGDEDLNKSEDDFASVKDSEDENEGEKFPVFNPVAMFNPTFELGMIFSTKTELRHAVHSHAIMTKRSINISKNDKDRIHAKCANIECAWKLHALRLTGEYTFQIRKYVPTHTCGASFRVKNLKSSWLSEKYVNKFRSDPKRNIKGFRVDVIQDIKCRVSEWQAYRAKTKAINILEGLPEEQYSLLWDFADEIKRTNPGSTVILGTDDSDGENRFDRFYLCLHALKKGFFAGCRHFIGVDGCHLKRTNGGVILTAVSVDPNNNIYPIAFAVVKTENFDTWEWFLQMLKVGFNIEKDYEWTFMSDKQKGLIQAFNNVFPNAEHRFCVRHLYSNFKNAGFKGQTFKTALWNCAGATTVNEFGRKRKQLRDINEKASDWFNDKPPQHWSRSHFTSNCKCDMLLNNGCESFNSNILEARDRPIVSMCEWIFEYLMKRMQINRDKAAKWQGAFCPKIQKIIDKNMEKCGDCIPIKSDDYHYQISCCDGTKYSVDLRNGTCGCRRWDLNGIPCNHALCTIGSEGLDYGNYVHNSYRVDTYKMVYAPVIIPINGRSEWRQTGGIPLLPPIVGRPIGRPKKTRRREPDEPEVKLKKRSRGKEKVTENPHAMRKMQKTVKCSLCGVLRHNKASCPSKNRSSIPLGTEPVGESQEQPLSQLTQEMETDRLFGSKVRRESHCAENVVKRQANISGKYDNITAAAEATTATSTLPIPNPSMFEQLRQCQLTTHSVNIRAPAPFVGGCFIPSIDKCITQPCIASKQIITEGGKKYVTMSNLASALSQIKNAKISKDKGKKPSK